MAGSTQSVLLALLAASLVPVAQGEADPVAPAAPVAGAPAATEPASSAKLTKLFAGTPPKFEPPQPESAVPAPAQVSISTDQPRNTIVRLPTYIVRADRRLPDEYHMLTPQARQDAIVKRYVGEPTGLDLLLNKYTVNNTIWKKIPVLGTISSFGWTTRSGADRKFELTNPSAGPSVYSSSTPGDRVALDYSKIESKRLYIEALGVSADVPPSPAKSKDEKPASVPADE